MPGLFYVEKYVKNIVSAVLYDGNHPKNIVYGRTGRSMGEKMNVWAEIKRDERIFSIDDVSIVISGQVTILVEYTCAGV